MATRRFAGNSPLTCLPRQYGTPRQEFYYRHYQTLGLPTQRCPITTVGLPKVWHVRFSHWWVWRHFQDVVETDPRCRRAWFVHLQDHDNGGSKHPWNVGLFLPNYTAQHPRRHRTPVPWGSTPAFCPDWAYSKDSSWFAHKVAWQ
jgi:hypothetical protein